MRQRPGFGAAAPSLATSTIPEVTMSETNIQLVIDCTEKTMSAHPGHHVLRNSAGAIIALCPLFDRPVCEEQFSYAPLVQRAVNEYAEMLDLLSKVYEALDGEEESVKEEHEVLIHNLEAFLARRNDKATLPAHGSEAALEDKIYQLQEIADGAWGDGPATRGAARDMIAQLQAKPKPAAKSFRYTAESCPSKHQNDGDDICADCGTFLG
jgi:hypothetical protein